MGIAIRELLSLEYFNDFQVLAGRKGIHKEVQGITVLDAPDGFHWTKGKELILSCGYVIVKEPNCIQKAFQEGSLQKCAGVMIKRERYLDRVPDELLRLFDQYDVPLISMPFSVPWMEVMSQINTAVMNRTIRRFRIHTGNAFQLSNMSYKEQKIKRILQAVEAEMKFPAFLYDISEETGYYSSSNFQRIAESFGLKDPDFWEPSKPFTKHTLCDYVQMVRYRLIEQNGEDEARVSWIMMPISMNGQNQAYFVVMESRELLDYYDEYAIRIAFILLQAVYEQIMTAQNAGNIGFENFVHFVLNSGDGDTGTLMYQANVQGISMSESYVYVVFRQKNEETSARALRRQYMEIFQKCFLSPESRMAFLEENEGVFFLDESVWGKQGSVRLKDKLTFFYNQLKKQMPGMELEFGILDTPARIAEMKSSIEKCQKVLDMGRILRPDAMIWDYESLGPLVWLQIPEEELKVMLHGYEELLQDEKNAELLRTLKIYLENNMNYSVTAEKMFVHINTIRKRIDKLHDLLNTDWDDYLVRLKTELLLQFLNLE